MKAKKILIDNGHGEDTPGKCSPDRRLREYKYCREIAQIVVCRLKAKGLDAELLTPEQRDVSISTRCGRANAWCGKLGSKNVVLVSIHNNAAGGDGQWHNARGWLSIIDDAASKEAQKLADIFFDQAKAHGVKTRQPMPSKKYYLYSQATGKPGKRLGILRGSKCPAVLTENLFQDNADDVSFLLSPEGKSTIADIHVEAIEEYINTIGT